MLALCAERPSTPGANPSTNPASIQVIFELCPNSEPYTVGCGNSDALAIAWICSVAGGFVRSLERAHPKRNIVALEGLIQDGILERPHHSGNNCLSLT